MTQGFNLSISLSLSRSQFSKYKFVLPKKTHKTYSGSSFKGKLIRSIVKKRYGIIELKKINEYNKKILKIFAIHTNKHTHT